MKVSKIVELYEKGVISDSSTALLLNSYISNFHSEMAYAKKYIASWKFFSVVMYIIAGIGLVNFFYPRPWLAIVSCIVDIIALGTLLNWRGDGSVIECYKRTDGMKQIQTNLTWWSKMVDVSEKFILVATAHDLTTKVMERLDCLAVNVVELEQFKKVEEAALPRAMMRALHKAASSQNIIRTELTEFTTTRLANRKPKTPTHCPHCDVLLRPKSTHCHKCGKTVTK